MYAPARASRGRVGYVLLRDYLYEVGTNFNVAAGMSSPTQKLFGRRLAS
jgi:hypothetical protein